MREPGPDRSVGLKGAGLPISKEQPMSEASPIFVAPCAYTRLRRFACGSRHN